MVAVTFGQPQAAAAPFSGLLELTWHHADRCEPIANHHCSRFEAESVSSLHPIFLPCREAFKDLDLCGMSPEKVVKTMTSSGTSGQNVSHL